MASDGIRNSKSQKSLRFRALLSGVPLGIRSLERLAGVKAIGVDRTKNEARVSLEGTASSVDQMIAAIQRAGRFQAKPAAG
jgi:hypothetical protein